jgi:hypothetical protein
VLPSAEPVITPILLRIMENVYSVLGTRPAGLSHPSQGNWQAIYTPGSVSVNAPNTQNSA